MLKPNNYGIDSYVNHDYYEMLGSESFVHISSITMERILVVVSSIVDGL